MISEHKTIENQELRASIYDFVMLSEHKTIDNQELRGSKYDFVMFSLFQKPGEAWNVVGISQLNPQLGFS